MTTPYLTEGLLSGYTLEVRNDISGVPHSFIVIKGPNGFEQGYGFAPANPLYPVGAGAIFDDTTSDYNADITSDIISLSPEQYNALALFVNDSIDNPPGYNFFTGSECSNWVMESINEAFSINTGLGFPPPYNLSDPIADFLLSAMGTLTANPYTLGVHEYAQDKIEELWNAMTLDPRHLQNERGLIHVISPVSGAFIDTIEVLWNAIQSYFSPIVLDIDGTGGIELTNISTDAVYFDYNNDGYAEKAATVTGGDGFLAIDLNADGIINNGGELFGDQTGYNNGFLALQQYDSNEDGAITAEDARWDDLKIWIDANLNGFSESTELQTLDALLITQINLNYTDANYQIAGNDIRQESTFVINGNTQDVADVYFAADTVNTVFDQDYTLDSDVLFLPTLRGYGDIADLHIAASIDNAGTGNLKTLLTDFAEQDFATLFAANGNVIDDVREILYRWAGPLRSIAQSNRLRVCAHQIIHPATKNNVRGMQCMRHVSACRAPLSYITGVRDHAFAAVNDDGFLCKEAA